MNLAVKSVCFLILCTILMASPPAGAGCTRSAGEIQGSPERARLLRQLGYRWDQSKVPSDELIYARAARLGYLIGRQARYIGDSAERNEMYDCVYDSVVEDNVSFATIFGANPARADTIFQQAKLGILEEDDLERFSIDAQGHYPSIFDPDWIGRWDVVFLEERKSGTKPPMEANLSIEFEHDSSGKLYAKVGAAGEVKGPFAVSVDDRSVAFQMPEGTMRHQITLSQHNHTSCTGSISTVVDGAGEILRWTGPGQRQ